MALGSSTTPPGGSHRCGASGPRRGRTGRACPGRLQQPPEDLQAATTSGPMPSPPMTAMSGRSGQQCRPCSETRTTSRDVGIPSQFAVGPGMPRRPGQGKGLDRGPRGPVASAGARLGQVLLVEPADGHVLAGSEVAGSPLHSPDEPGAELRPLAPAPWRPGRDAWPSGLDVHAELLRSSRARACSRSPPLDRPAGRSQTRHAGSTPHGRSDLQAERGDLRGIPPTLRSLTSRTHARRPAAR